MPRDTKPPLARDATRRPSTGEASCSRQKRQMESCRASGTRPESQHLRYYRAGPLVPCWRSSSSWEVQSPDSSGTSKKKGRKKGALRQPPRNAERPCRNLLLFFQYPALGRHTVSTGRDGDSMVRISLFTAAACPAPSNPKSPRDVSPSLPHTRGKIEHAPMPQTRSFFSGGGEPATTPCPDDLHEYGLALLELCLRKNRELVWCLVCVEWPPNLFDAPDQQCIV